MIELYVCQALKAPMGNKKKNMIILGSGGHAKTCIEIIESFKSYNISGIKVFIFMVNQAEVKLS